jgi:hypothetical protein
MAATAIYLETHASYESTTRHADSIIHLLTNANFRSLFLWVKEEIKNKRDNMDYEVIESVPSEFRIYLLDQMTRLGEIFNIRRLEAPANRRPKEFSMPQWLAKIRSMFGVSNGHAYLKQAMVDSLGSDYGWDHENLAYGKFPDGKEKMSPVDHVLFEARKSNPETLNQIDI